MANTVTIGQYLIERLHAQGVGHMFGVPGDFILKFMAEVCASPIKMVNTSDEQGAIFAADAYGRVRGLGVACVTYMVGGLKVANGTGQAFAEESPVVVISGSPGLSERRRQKRLHHVVRDYDDQLQIFKHLTLAQAVIDNPETATREIDRVIDAAMRWRRPVYLEIPRDMVDVEVQRVPFVPGPEMVSDLDALNAAVEEAIDRLKASKRPMLMLGVQVQRFGMEAEALALAEKTGMPIVETLLGKSSIDPDHPNYLGVYAGGMGLAHVTEAVEASDCLVILGSFLSDLETGNFTARLKESNIIHAIRGRLSMGYHDYDVVRADDFLRALAKADLPRLVNQTVSHPQPTPWTPIPPETPMTADRLFADVGARINENVVVIADPGDALGGGLDLPINRSAGFLCPAFYASLGFAVPASIGVGLALPTARPLVLVGDGAFQMGGTELSTAVRFGVAPIVIVINNDGYAIERYMLDGTFNDILRWEYSKLPDLLGAGNGFRVETEGEFQAALDAAFADTSVFSIIDVRIGKLDVSDSLKRLTSSMANTARGQSVA